MIGAPTVRPGPVNTPAPTPEPTVPVRTDAPMPTPRGTPTKCQIGIIDAVVNLDANDRAYMFSGRQKQEIVFKKDKATLHVI